MLKNTGCVREVGLHSQGCPCQTLPCWWDCHSPLIFLDDGRAVEYYCHGEHAQQPRLLYCTSCVHPSHFLSTAPIVSAFIVDMPFTVEPSVLQLVIMY
jgi:hypothetical protein